MDSPPPIPPPTATHEVAARRFTIEFGGHCAELDYAREEDRVVFTHTFVPPELRGRGLAEQLVRPALAWARAEKLRVVPACSYVAKFIERNPEFKDLLA